MEPLAPTNTNSQVQNESGEIYAVASCVPPIFGRTAIAAGLTRGWRVVYCYLGLGGVHRASLQAIHLAVELSLPGEIIFSLNKVAVKVVTGAWRAKKELVLVDEIKSLRKQKRVRISLLNPKLSPLLFRETRRMVRQLTSQSGIEHPVADVGGDCENRPRRKSKSPECVKYLGGLPLYASSGGGPLEGTAKSEVAQGESSGFIVLGRPPVTSG